MAGARVHGKSRRLVHHQHLTILVDDIQWHGFRGELGGPGRRHDEGDAVPRPERTARLGNVPVHQDVTLIQEPPHPRPGQVRLLPGEVQVQPLFGLFDHQLPGEPLLL